MAIIPARLLTVYSSVHISKEKTSPNGWYVFASKHISSVEQKHYDKWQETNSRDPAGHSASHQKHWSALRHNSEAQSETNPPTLHNICLNLTQALLITHSAWAGDRQHRQLWGRDLYANCVQVCMCVDAMMWYRLLLRQSRSKRVCNMPWHCMQIK